VGHNIDENGYDGERSCGSISNRLFQYQGKIYYEHNIDNKEGVKYTISQLRGSTTKSVCEYGREIRTKVYPLSMKPQGRRVAGNDPKRSFAV
jgi:hypothetical protein